MLNRLKNSWPMLFCTALTLSCNQATSHPNTDLGERGNALVAQQFSDYKQKREQGLQGCNSSGHGKRILLTGFGPFQGISQNISGAAADSLSNSEFWPASASVEDLSIPPDFPALNSFGSPLPNGIRASQREIAYNGENIVLCTLILDVKWDLAAAAIIFEANNFSPQAILMMGRGGASSEASLEFSAVNNASALPGFSSTGASLGASNTPVQPYVLEPEKNIRNTIQLSWNNVTVEQFASGALDDLNALLSEASSTPFQFTSQHAPSPGNTYICNNVAFVVQHAALGFKIKLASDKIIFAENSIPNEPIVGFFHFPTKAKTFSQSLWAWDHVILNVAIGMMQ